MENRDTKYNVSLAAILESSVARQWRTGVSLLSVFGTMET